jgi:hypothetical protein
VDLINAGETYLKMFKKRKDQHKTEKRRRRAEVRALINEIEDMIKMLSDQGVIAKMNWLDLDAEEDASDEKLKERIEAELNAQQEREANED